MAQGLSFKIISITKGIQTIRLSIKNSLCFTPNLPLLSLWCGIGAVRFTQYDLFCFFTLVTGPRRSLSLQLSDTRIYAPQIRARLGTTVCFTLIPRGVQMGDTGHETIELSLGTWCASACRAGLSTVFGLLLSLQVLEVS